MTSIGEITMETRPMV